MKQHYFYLLLACLACQPWMAWGQGVSVDLEFTPPTSGNQLSPLLSHWVIGTQDIKILLYNDNTIPAKVHLELKVSYNGDVIITAARIAALDVKSGDNWVTRYTEGVNFGEVLQGQLPSAYQGDYFSGVVDPVQIGASGRLPAGHWSFCAEAYDFESGALLDETCVEGIVSEIQPPTLVFPAEDTTLIAGAGIRLQWLSYAPLFGELPRVELVVYEILDGQNEIQAMLSNEPVFRQLVIGTTQVYWMPSAQMVMPGQRGHYIWTVIPAEPGTLIQDNKGAAEPETFWIADRTQPLELAVSDSCCKIDLGPDLTRECDAPPTMIGKTLCPGSHAEWFSEPDGFRAYGSVVGVHPQQTTRYIIKVTSASGCVTYDDIWVAVWDWFEVYMEHDTCDLNIKIDNRISCCNPVMHEPAVNITVKSYDKNGDLIPSETICEECMAGLPPARSSPPDSNKNCQSYSYKWNTGDSTASVHIQDIDMNQRYRCTVSNGGFSVVAVADIDYTSLVGEFPLLEVTKRARFDTVGMPFRIRHVGLARGQEFPFHALDYKLTITGPNGYSNVLEGTTKNGFLNGDIQWTGPPLPKTTVGVVESHVTTNTNTAVGTNGSTSSFSVGSAGQTQGTVNVGTGSTVSPIGGNGTPGTSSTVAAPIAGATTEGPVGPSTEFDPASVGGYTEVYTWELSLTNCTYPQHSTTRKYKVRYVWDALTATGPINTIGFPSLGIGVTQWKCSGTFRVKN